MRCTHWDTHKKKTTLSPQRERPEVKERRAAFELDRAKFDPEKLVFLDESGMHPGMGPRRGWTPRGERFFGHEQPYARGQRVSLIGAISLKGLLASQVVDGGMKSGDFLRFLKHLGPKLTPGQLVCMDNLQAHKSNRVKEILSAFGVKPLFLPPYSPDFNPIEAAWSKIKHLARKAASSSVPLLKNAIRTAFKAVTPDDVKGWFTYCRYLGNSTDP